MQWILLLGLLNAFKLTKTQSDTYVTVTSSQCSKTYDMSMHSSIYLEYSGSDLLYTDRCEIEFLNEESREKVICVTAKKLSVDCETKLEYHEDFVKNYIDPEKRITCEDTSVGEWCSVKYTDNVFIVIRKSNERSSDNIELRLYRKELPDDSINREYSSLSSRVFLYSLVPMAVVMVIVVVAVCVRKKAMKESRGHPQVAYQTTSGAVNMQAGQGYGSPYPTVAGYQPVQQWAERQGNYNVHPMQTAFPAQQGPNPPDGSATESSAYGQNYPRAPTFNTAASPPSYESVVGMKH